MSAADEALISTVAAAVAAVAALIAVVVSAVNAVYARKQLTESRATITELRKLQEEGQGTIDELRKLGDAARAETQAEQATTLALNMILAESQVARALEQLQEIARQVFEVKRAMQAVRESRARDWHELNDAKLLLAAMLSVLPAEELPACRGLADASTDPRTDTTSADLATEEIRVAIGRWRLRMAEIATQANAQLRRLALTSESEPARSA
jgi:hypothetical protein